MRDAGKAIFSDCGRSLEAIGTAPIDDLRGARLLLTGATGFVGTWLLSMIAYLNEHHRFGIRTTALSRRPSRLAQSAPFLAGREDIRPVMADVRQYVDIEEGTNWIIHAAAVPDSRHHATSPIETASVIAEGTARLLRMAEQAENLLRLLHFSSGLVQSRQRSEQDGRVGASSVYTEAKSFSEALCAAYRTQARLPIVITRPYTFLGPFQALDAPWAVNNFLHAALNGQPLKLLGDGRTERSYLYGSDMAALSLHQLVRGKSGDTYDLGGIEPLPLVEVAKTVMAQANRPLDIRVNTGGRQAGPSSLVPNMAPSVAAFGFRPAFSPTEAIARTFAWYEHNGLADARR